MSTVRIGICCGKGKWAYCSQSLCVGGEDVIRYIIWVLTLAVERRVSQASGPLRDEAWMRTGEERRLRSRLPSPSLPETTILMRFNLKMNQQTTSYRTNIAAKRELALLVQSNFQTAKLRTKFRNLLISRSLIRPLFEERWGFSNSACRRNDRAVRSRVGLSCRNNEILVFFNKDRVFHPS